MRARSIKPGFFFNEHLISLTPLHRLLFAGLWCLADREGRLEDRPAKIKFEILPGDDCDIDQMLEDLAASDGMIMRYQVGGRRFLQVMNFCKHQLPHYKETASVIAPPPENASPSAGQARMAASLTDDQPMIDQSLIHDQPMINQSLIHDRSKKVLDDPLNPDSLTPDSLTPDSLTADSLSAIRLLTSVAKPATEDLRLNGFHPTKPTKKPKSHTMNPKVQTENVDAQTSRPKSSNPRASPPIENPMGKKPSGPSYPPEFEQFWQQYPRQTEKKRAFRAWKARIRDQVDARELIRAAQHYAAHCRRRRTDLEYIKHPSTFLGPLEVYRDWIDPLRKGGEDGDDRRPDYERDLNLLSF